MNVSLAYGMPVKSFDAGAPSGAVEGSIFAIPIMLNAQGFIWQTSFATAPSAVSLSLRVSIDGVNWTIIDTSTATAGETRTILNKLGLFVQGYQASRTGGTAVTLRIVFF
jgi:hypothetical protein